VEYDVLAIAVSSNGTPLAEPRTERINVDENPIFAGCNGPWDVEDRYHAFWNRLNDWWEGEIQAEKVLVVNVKPV
jgi:hypothetical protein